MIVYNNHYLGGILLDNQYFSCLPPEKVKEKINFQSRLLESVNDSIVVAGLDGKISYWNKGSERLFGWLAAEIIGRPFSVLIEESNNQDITKQVTEIQAGFWEGRITILTKNKVRKYVRVSITAMYDHSDKPSYLVGVFSDITELIESKIQAEEALRSKGEFLANMSHEIRTPITGILGNVELLSSLSLDEKQEYYLHSIKENADQLLNLINDLLDISKIEADKLLLDESKFNLEKLILSVIKIFAPIIDKKQLNLSVEISDDLPKEIISDQVRIKQILSNLLSNAIKFTENGEIKVCVGQGEMVENKFNLIVEVIDTGIGIPVDKLNSIFEPFTQADSSTTRKYGGTGLGLSICKKLIEIFKGEIQVESEIGKGSKFLFSIPVSSTASNTNTDLSFSNNFQQNGRKLLLISTNKELFVELTRDLSDSGLQLLWLKNELRISSINSFYEPEIVVVDYNTIPLESCPNAPNLYCLSNPGYFPRIMPKSCKCVDSLAALVHALKALAFPALTTNPIVKTADILIIDENSINVLLIEKILQNQGYVVHSAANILEVAQIAGKKPFDIILVDLEMLKKYDEPLYNQIKLINYKALIAIAKLNDNYNDELINDFLYKPVTSNNLLTIIAKHIKEGVYE